MGSAHFLTSLFPVFAALRIHEEGLTKEELRIFEAFFKLLYLGYEPLKSHSKIRSSSFVHPSEIFVWGAYFDRHRR
jgi:hypothetical protein